MCSLVGTIEKSWNLASVLHPQKNMSAKYMYGNCEMAPDAQSLHFALQIPKIVVCALVTQIQNQHKVMGTVLGKFFLYSF